MPDDSMKNVIRESEAPGKELEGSNKSGSSNENIELTDTVKFILPSSDGSPPKILSLDEVSQLSKNMENMTLIHEIALNPEFKLKPHEPVNSLEKIVKEMIHKAFWNVLREQLNSDPPCYDHALQLLTEIKECFPHIIPERNKKVLEIINETLDSALIYQQAKNNTLNFKAYADFVIDILAKSCAPIRDEQILNLSKITDVVDIFKGILEIITLMKLDMANCILEFTKNELVANAIEYEKNKFQETLKYNTNFPAIKSWLQRNEIMNENSEKINSNETIFRAYMELLDWNSSNDFPEILVIDKERLQKLSVTAKKLCICSTICAVLSTFPMCRKEKLKTFSNEIYILLEGATSEADINNSKENIWVHIKTTFPEEFSEDQSTKNTGGSTMKAKIFDATNKNSLVYKLMWKRLITYICLILKTKSTPPPPPGFEIYSNELESFVLTFKRIIMYNYSVYGEYYLKIIHFNKQQEIETN